MKNMKLPDLEYHTVDTLSNELDCHPSHILLHAEQGKIKALVKNKGWKIEYGKMEKHDMCGHLPVMKDIAHLPDTRLTLRPWTVEEIRCNGSTNSPEFEYQGYDYARIFYEDEGRKIGIGVNDIIFDNTIIQSLFNVDNTHQIRDVLGQENKAAVQHQKGLKELVSEIPTKTTLNNMKAVYYEHAMPFMHEYEQQKKKEPTRNEVAYHLFEKNLSNHSTESILRTLDYKELCRRYAQYKKSLGSSN